MSTALDTAVVAARGRVPAAWAASGIIALLALLPAWPPALHAALLAVALAWLPGALAARVLAPDRGPAWRTLLALVLSPALTGALAAAMLAAGVPLPRAASLVVAAVGLAALTVAAVAARTPHRVGLHDPGDQGAPWAAASIWAAIVAALLIGNPALRPRHDGSFHAAIALQILERGVRLDHPYLAGLPIHYFWGVHVWAAMWLALAPALSVWTPFIACNLGAAFAAMLGVGLIARRLGADRRGTTAAAILAVVGYAPFFWLVPWLRAAVGVDYAPAQIRGLLTDGGTGTFYNALNFRVLHVSMVFFGDKFLIPTQFSLGMAGFCALALAMLDAIQRPRARPLMAVAALEGAALFIHTFVGYVGVIVAGAWSAWAAWRSRVPAERALRRAVFALPAAVAVAVVARWPDLAAPTPGKRQDTALGLHQISVTTWLGAGAVLVPPALVWLWRRRRGPGPARELLGFVLILSVAGLVLWLPSNNQSKIFNLLFLVVAAPAALAWLEWHDRLARPWRAALLIVLSLGTLPGTLLGFHAYAAESARHAPAYMRPISDEERAGWAWVRAHTPASAVMIDLDGEYHGAMAGRSVLWVPEWEWTHPGEETLVLRRGVVSALRSGVAPRPDQAEFLAGLGREIIVVAHAKSPRGLEPPPGTRPLFRNAAIAFFRWEPVR